MHILMPCKVRADVLRGVQETLQARGIDCTLYRYESADRLRRKLCEKAYDAVLSAESAVLSHVPRTVPTIYFGAEFHCADKRLPSDLSAYWIAQEELAFECMTHGARDRNVQVCGIPLRPSYRTRETRTAACRSLGIEPHQMIFSVFTDGSAPNEIKSTVRSVRVLSPEMQVLLWSGEANRRSFWQSYFAPEQSVFVPDVEPHMPIALAAADAVFCPAFAPLVCAAARQEKIVILLHTALSRARKNAAFLDAHGAAFCGKTAADNVSYACRLLSSERLRGNMLSAQAKYIVPDAEQRAEKFLREIVEK